MRPVVLLLACLLPCLATAVPAPAFAPPAKDSRPWGVRVAAQARRCVVEVRSTEKTQGKYELWGAGWAVRCDLVATCAHVVGQEKSARLVCACGKAFEADVVLADPGRDVAFLRLRGKARLPALKLACRPAEQGEDVLLMGHPMEQSWTLTRGIVSAVGQSITVQGNHLADLVQTDAAVNPGNSGGPILNCRGEVVGMCSCMHARARGQAWCVSAKTIAKMLQGP